VVFASHQAVSAMVFFLVMPSHFQRCTHMTKAVLLLSNFMSAVVGEVLRDFFGASLRLLFEISLVAQCLALIVSVALPNQSNSHEANQRIDQSKEAPQTSANRSELGSKFRTFSAPFLDLGRSFQLHGVVLWTVWALSMNPAHNVTLTYWQTLLPGTGHRDHNGYMVASAYLGACVLTAATSWFEVFRRCREPVVIGSMLVAGLLLCGLVLGRPIQFRLYVCLFFYQCLFEVTTAVATFQVGAEVKKAVATNCSRALHCKRKSPQQARLTLLFTFTAFVAAIFETLIQMIFTYFRHKDRMPMGTRFLGLGIGLVVCAFLLLGGCGLNRWCCARASREREFATRPSLTPRPNQDNAEVLLTPGAGM